MNISVATKIYTDNDNIHKLNEPKLIVDAMLQLCLDMMETFFEIVCNTCTAFFSLFSGKHHKWWSGKLLDSVPLEGLWKVLKVSRQKEKKEMLARKEYFAAQKHQLLLVQLLVVMILTAFEDNELIVASQ